LLAEFSPILKTPALNPGMKQFAAKQFPETQDNPAGRGV
jgi:hypothetical protein